MFEIKSYGKSELAMLYFPGTADPHVATNHLAAWIRRCKPLSRDLKALGVSKRAKLYTPKEVALIVHYFGEP